MELDNIIHDENKFKRTIVFESNTAHLNTFLAHKSTALEKIVLYPSWYHAEYLKRETTHLFSIKIKILINPIFYTSFWIKEISIDS